MSKLIKKLTGKSVRLGVYVEEILVTGSAVADKEVYCVRWYLKGARGGKDSGDSPNQYAAMDGEHEAPVVRFADVLGCEVSALPHKNSAGYNEVPLEFKVVSPALSKKDDKALGKASLDALRDVGTLTPPATVRTEQTVTLNKEGTATAMLRLRIEYKSGASDDDASVADDEPVTPTGTSGAQIVTTNEAQMLETTANTQDMLSGLVGVSGSSGSSRLLVREPRTPPSSPGTAFESMAASDAGSREKRSHRSHRSHHRSSSSSLKKEEEAAKAKKELEDALAAKTAEAEQLQARVAELEQAQQAAKEAQEGEEGTLKDALAKAESAAADAKADADKTRGELEKAQAELEQAQEAVRQAKQETQQAQQAAEAAARSAETDEQREQRNRELDALKKQLATLQDECVKLRSAPKAGAAAGKPNVVLLAIAAVIGAVLAIILSRIF